MDTKTAEPQAKAAIINDLHASHDALMVMLADVCSFREACGDGTLGELQSEARKVWAAGSKFIQRFDDATSEAITAETEPARQRAELLAALQSLLSSRETGERILDSQWACARRAIAKATR